MIDLRRGVLAALFLSAGLTLAATSASSAAQLQLAPGETTQSDGLTTLVRGVSGPGAVAIELWIRCPSDGYSSAQPGIARLAAFATVDAQDGGTALRDLVRIEGGQLSVSVFQTATEIAVLAPSYAAPELQDALLKSVFRGSVDAGALDAAKSRLAEQQVAAAASSAELLREAVFSTLYASGPMRASTFGDPASLAASTLDSVRGFIAQTYVPSNAILAVVGNADVGALGARLASASLPNGSAPPMPPSPPAAPSGSPLRLAPAQADVPGVALAWIGPPIADSRAATAMDFLSDYLADPDAGVLASAAARVNAGAAFEGQFVTLEAAGAFYVSASGTGVDPASMAAALRAAMDPVVSRALSRAEFARAIAAYKTRLLRQMDSPQGLADNYGWYFAQNAPSYAPSATDQQLSGDYFAAAASLTPDYVRGIAAQYLGGAPSAIYVMPNPVHVNVSSEGS
jgi:predicted Zn-dependent peptidase